MRIDFCKNCGDPITFAMDHKKYRIVLDPDPVAGGAYHLEGVAAAPRAVSAPADGSPAYMLHSKGCRNLPRRQRKRERVKGSR